MKPVFVFAVGFWAVGSLVCYSFAALDAFVKADAATIAPPLRSSAPYLRFVCLGLGLILGLFNAFLPRFGFVALAKRDAARIHALGDAAHADGAGVVSKPEGFRHAEETARSLCLLPHAGRVDQATRLHLCGAQLARRCHALALCAEQARLHRGGASGTTLG